MNIAEILKDKPKGTKLYSPAFGVLIFEEIHEYDNMIDVNETGICPEGLSFYFDGRYKIDGESVLFPSKQMRDWSKFAWKKGDTIGSKDGKIAVLFDSWANEEYTKFVGYVGITDEGIVSFGNVELNTCDCFRCEGLDKVSPAWKNVDKKLSINTIKITVGKPTHEFKPYDKVVARFNDVWCADIFSHKVEACNGYGCIGGYYDKILPYNEETAKLIGTTKTREDLK